ncbi:MAG: hypothetical protein EOO01_08215, partial [Chitinophagaceae bacterium]
PVLIRIDTDAGHGAGKPTSKSIEEAADTWSFVMHNLGMPFVEPKPTASSDSTRSKTSSGGMTGNSDSGGVQKKSLSNAKTGKTGSAAASNAAGTKGNPSAVSERELEARKQKQEALNKKRQQQ